MDNLSDYHLCEDPISSWESWFKTAKEKEVNAEAFTLSTIDSNGDPQGRLLLYKGMHEGKFTIYTNLESPKAVQLAESKKASMTFFWPSALRQIRILGDVEVMEPERAEAYFKKRERGSQIASFISRQSQPIEDRETLLQRFSETEKEYEGQEIPYPKERWGGFYIVPKKWEFFHYREFRLNDRFVYDQKNEKGWNIFRIQP
jgi:pyridoxamine 5'-phosphate oxidase